MNAEPSPHTIQESLLVGHVLIGVPDVGDWILESWRMIGVTVGRDKGIYEQQSYKDEADVERTECNILAERVNEQRR